MASEYKTKEQKAKFYNSGDWKRLRKHVRERDNNECQECKRQGKVFIDTNELNRKGTRKKIALIVHHKLELSDRPDLALDIDNLECLCVHCHNKLHDRYFQYVPWMGKRNKWHEDERW